jgi:hypothetical protein
MSIFCILKKRILQQGISFLVPWEDSVDHSWIVSVMLTKQLNANDPFTASTHNILQLSPMQ